MSEDLGPYLISAAEFRSFFESQLRWVEECIRAYDLAVWNPAVHVLGKHSPDAPAAVSLYSIVDGFATEEKKRAALRRVGEQVFRDSQVPLAVSLTCEGWATRPKSGEAPPALMCEDLQRLEVIIVTQMSLGMKFQALATAPLIRHGGHVVPPVFDSVATEGVQAFILQEFFRGFFHQTAKVNHGLN